VETVARHKVVMPDVPEVPLDAPMTIDDDTGAHWRPALAGAYLLFTDPDTPPTPPEDHVTPDHGLAFQLLKPGGPVSVARIAPFWRDVWERGTANWAMQSGHYTMTPDRRPLLGALGPEGLFINSGYSGHGIMGSAAGSRYMVDVMTGAIPTSDNAFAPDRTFEERDHDVL
jgi:glycine/D-amino acid oxidase-like deaminating enzyme